MEKIGELSSIGKLLEKYAKLGEMPTKQQETEYSYYLNESRKLIASPYIVLHKRLERSFDGYSFEFLLSKMKQWYHEAEKAKNPAITFNWRFKQFREQCAEAKKQKLS